MKQCRYCQVFDATPPKHRTTIQVEGGKKIHKRTCSLTKKVCQEHDEACELYFVPATFMWCEKEGQRCTLLRCMVRQRNNELYEGCIRCHQGKDVLQALRGVRTVNGEAPKPAIVKRRR